MNYTEDSSNTTSGSFQLLGGASIKIFLLVVILLFQKS